MRYKMTEDNIKYPSDIKKTKVVRVRKKSGVVKLKSRKIMGTRSPKSSLISEHIIEATNKGKGAYVCMPIKIYMYIRDKIINRLKQ